MSAPIDLREIQGNILAGFNKDFASFLLFALPAEQEKAKAWLRELVDEVATTDEVKAFNDLFRLIRENHRDREGLVQATWMNLALTYSGLAALAVPGLEGLPDEFRDGMRKRADLIGDREENAPDKWPAGLGSATIHALMIIAADSADDRNRATGNFVRHAARHGVMLVFHQNGRTRSGTMRGHEHFGFKDGISQPQVAGLTDAKTPDAELIEPGEFVLGCKRQGEPDNPLVEPPWLKNGSYLVFRRLAQDVAGFDDFVRATAAREGWTADLVRAKLVGRYRSGAPLEGAKNSPVDPGSTTGAELNDFGYSEDTGGDQVPRAAHIRKTYPRDQLPPGDEEADRRRILRRGIPFGQSYEPDAEPQSPRGGDVAFPHDRGLCFVCYQRSIADQFEVLQRDMVNRKDFPSPGDGVDPLISQASEVRSFSMPGAATTPLQLAKQWVTTTGGEYFFSPSIGALRQFAWPNSMPT